MDLQKAKILLEKINALHKSMSSDPRNVSAIERDLMRSYVRQLYEIFLDLPMGTQAHPDSYREQVEVFKSAPKVAPPARPEPAPTPKPQPAPTPKPQPAPVVQERQAPPPPPRPVVQAPPPEEVLPPPPPPPKPVVQAPPPEELPASASKYAPKPDPVATAAVPHTLKPTPQSLSDGEFDELFLIASAKEISEKLSQLPITDIKKAMGINERILNVRELFGGDQAAFDTAVDTINRMGSFDEAKHYLAQQVAGRFGWNQKDRKEAAKSFIKLVKRRFA